MKKVDLTKTVYELTKEYPELIDILSNLGFTEITKKTMLNSVGKLMTIPKGAKMKNISMMDVVGALMSNGFELEGSMPTIDSVEKTGSKSKSESRKEQIMDYLKRLSNGEELSLVQADFIQHFKDVEASEIMEAEQALLMEGTPLEEVQRLCDVHSALFHGATKEEKIMRAEAAVEESLRQQKSDTTNRFNIPGHPLYTFSKENQAFIRLLEQFKITRSDELFNQIREISIHYAKKGDLLYPNLKVRYGITGPSDVMWSVDDEIRDGLAQLAKIKERDDTWNRQLDAILNRAEEMIFKEQNILFPICDEHFTDEEWAGIYRDSKDYAICFGVKNENWKEAEQYTSTKSEDNRDEIVMPGGHMTVEQITALLNTIPLEITFVDANNINRFFNEGHKVFKRPGMAIDREVFSCHPPKVEVMVRSIIESFRNGSQDSVPVWMEKNGRTMLVTYMAVRDSERNYLGTMEIIQDMEFAKAHFQQ